MSVQDIGPDGKVIMAEELPPPYRSGDASEMAVHETVPIQEEKSKQVAAEMFDDSTMAEKKEVVKQAGDDTNKMKTEDSTPRSGSSKDNMQEPDAMPIKESAKESPSEVAKSSVTMSSQGLEPAGTPGASTVEQSVPSELENSTSTPEESFIPALMRSEANQNHALPMRSIEAWLSRDDDSEDDSDVSSADGSDHPASMDSGNNRDTLGQEHLSLEAGDTRNNRFVREGYNSEPDVEEEEDLAYEGPDFDEDGKIGPEPPPTTKHYVAFYIGRISQSTVARQRKLLSSLRLTAQKHQSFLQDPNSPHPEGIEPAPVCRQGEVAFARQGINPLPIVTDPDSVSPSLNNFVTALQDPETGILRDNNPNVPVEFQLVVNGWAGACVDIRGYGDYNGGFFRTLLDSDQRNGRGTQLADSTYLFFTLEPHVVNGLHNYSVQPGTDLTQNPQWFHMSGSKCVAKFSLRKLIDLHLYLRHSMWIGPLTPGLPAPHVAHPMYAHVARNRVAVKSMWEEYAYRAGLLK